MTSRDSAYHQGTVWPWLMGPFISAYRRVHGDSQRNLERLKGLLSGFEAHIETAGLGQISEVADANPPHTPGGCIAQAWSVGEILRAIVEDIGGLSPSGPAKLGDGRSSSWTLKELDHISQDQL